VTWPLIEKEVRGAPLFFLWNNTPFAFKVVCFEEREESELGGRVYVMVFWVAFANDQFFVSYGGEGGCKNYRPFSMEPHSKKNRAITHPPRFILIFSLESRLLDRSIDLTSQGRASSLCHKLNNNKK